MRTGVRGRKRDDCRLREEKGKEGWTLEEIAGREEMTTEGKEDREGKRKREWKDQN